jgi:hypothetical protein
VLLPDIWLPNSKFWNFFKTIFFVYNSLFLIGFDKGYTAGYKISQYFGRLRGIEAARKLAAKIVQEEKEEENRNQQLTEVEASVIIFARTELHEQVDSEVVLEAEDWIRKSGHQETIRTLTLDLHGNGTGTGTCIE